MAISEFIYGLHDAGGESHMGANKGWIVWTQAIGTSGSGGDDYSHHSNQGYGVIVRLNHGYESSGTLPVEAQYDQFAARCADYVASSHGVDYWIIGNECNLPREWPQNINGDPNTGEAITATRYVKCYNKCYAAIKAKSPNAQICPAPTATWSPPFPGRGVDDFLKYWTNCLTGIGAAKIDGLILHAYTHGCDPSLVTSTEKMQNDPYKDVYYHFFVYKNLMAAIPADMRTKPVLITECDQLVECGTGSNPIHAWRNTNSGWVRNIYEEIDRWNRANTQKIRCVALFRWELATEGPYTFGIRDKPGVIADFEGAVAASYKWGVVIDPGDLIPGVPIGTNVARTATVATDSNFSASYTGQKAIDGIISQESKWTSANTPPPHWLKLDLGAHKTVTGFIVRHAESGGVDASFFNTQAFCIQSGQTFDGPWTNEGVVNNSAQDEETFLRYPTPKSLRYVRLFITDPGPDNYARIPEFEVVGQGDVVDPGDGDKIKQNFETMPPWSSSFDAVWGGPAKFTIVPGGTIGNCLRAKRLGPGSSSRVQVFPIPANRSCTISIWMRSSGGSTPYWAECAFKLGEAGAADFDAGNGWTLIKKFSNQVSGDVSNGNGNVWTKYTRTFQSQANTRLSVGFKLGGQADTAPIVKWDTLRIKV